MSQTPITRPSWATDEVCQALDKKLVDAMKPGGVTFTQLEIERLREMIRQRPGTNQVVGDNTEARVHDIIVGLADEGYCYVNLFLSMPYINKASDELIVKTCNVMKKRLGTYPKGLILLPELTSAASVIAGNHPIETYALDSVWPTEPEDHLDLLKRMMKSKTTYKIDDSTGFVHISEACVTCTCGEVICDHGWSSSYVLALTTREGTLIGGDGYSMSDLGLSKKVPQSVTMEPSVDEETVYNSSLKSNLDRDMVEMMSAHLENRTSSIEKMIASIVEERMSRMDDTKAAGRISVQADSSDDEMTVMPLDSRSQIGGHRKTFMKQGSVLQVSSGKSEVKKIPAYQSRKITKQNVAQGYMKTEEMQQVEQDESDRMPAINGLTNPFKSDRLNLLCHFHTALDKGPNLASPVDVLEELSYSKPKNPTDELLRQVIQRTFDFESMSVKSNIFDLPYVEIGMDITDRHLFQCFALAKAEYKTLWFSEMKCLAIPDFHNEFSKFEDVSVNYKQRDGHRRKPRRESSSGSSRSTTPPRQVSYRTRPSAKQSSVLSTVFK